MQWLRRLFQRNRPQIPEILWHDCVARMPFLRRLSDADLLRLKQLAETLLDTKGITAAGGLDLTDEIAVLVAAQAALPVLNLSLDLYRDMAGIIVYPSAFIVSHSEVDEDGVVHEWQEPLSGEAVNSGGAVVLSWEDAQYDLDDLGHPGSGAACNVVIHEFAHKIDMLRGDANGYPPFLAKYHQGISAELWQQGFTRAYADFSARLDVLEQQLPPDFDPDDPACAAHYDALTAALPLDPYAAYHPAEFFAVASEAFFVRPAPMAAAYPEIYRLLSQYYRQDTLNAA